MTFQIDDTTLTIIISAVTAIISGTAVWSKFKSKMDAFRQFIDDADNAIQDNTVTEDEFRKIWNDGKALL